MSQSNVNLNKKQASQSIIGAGLSQVATNILVNNLSAKTLAGAAGTDPATLDVAEVTLACVDIDESGSLMDDRDAVVAEFAADLDAVKKSKQADEILMSLWAFNTRTRMIHSYLTLELVEGLNDYHPDGQTALYDSILDSFTSLVAYASELSKRGIIVKTNVAVFTDGMDNASRASADDVKRVSEELLKQENCTLSLSGFGTDLDPDVIARSIGFPTVVKVGSTPKERRRAWGTWSSSVIKTSQTTIGGSKSGFYTP